VTDYRGRIEAVVRRDLCIQPACWAEGGIGDLTCPGAGFDLARLSAPGMLCELRWTVLMWLHYRSSARNRPEEAAPSWWCKSACEL
jgi:hypothetical protein